SGWRTALSFRFGLRTGRGTKKRAVHDGNYSLKVVTARVGYFRTLAFRYLAVNRYQSYKCISNNADLGNGAEGHDPQPPFFVPKRDVENLCSFLSTRAQRTGIYLYDVKGEAVTVSHIPLIPGKREPQ